MNRYRNPIVIGLGRISLWPNIADRVRNRRCKSTAESYFAIYLFIGRWMVRKRRAQRLMNGQQLAGSNELRESARCAEASDDAIFVDDDGHLCLLNAETFNRRTIGH